MMPIKKAELLDYQKQLDDWGNTLEMKIWRVPSTPDKPHGFKYSLVYIVDGVRVIGYDNAEQRGDHRHYGPHEELYQFVSLRELADDFLRDVDDYRKRFL